MTAGLSSAPSSKLTRKRSGGPLAIALVTLGVAGAVAYGRWGGGGADHGGGGAEAARAPVRGYRLVNRFPHDPDGYTQGLVFLDGELFESTGRWGESSIRRVALETGEVLHGVQLPAHLFGEGLAAHGGRLVQLTWKAGRAIVYDAATLEHVGERRYAGEGWGLGWDGTHFVLSDGSDRLRFLEPETFEVARTVSVRDGDRPVRNLNELEVVDGAIWANLWKSDRIAVIDPATGVVREWVDLSGIADFPPVQHVDAVLNGIAWDAQGKRLFVTGKLWPALYEIVAE